MQMLFVGQPQSGVPGIGIIGAMYGDIGITDGAVGQLCTLGE
jgi:hypothetical protein